MSVPSWNFSQDYPKEKFKFGEYLKNSGRTLNCRLDFRLTSLEELKKAAFILNELNKQLQVYAYEQDGDEVLRVMLARDAMKTAQIALKYWYANGYDKHKKPSDKPTKRRPNVNLQIVPNRRKMFGK